jgi:hypothetical protein
MLRHLLMVLVLVFGMVLFAGCEQDGANGTTDGDGIYQEEEAVEEDTMQDEPVEDEYNLQRGMDRDTTDTTPQDDMQDQTQNGMQQDTTTPQDTTTGTNGTDPNATSF